MNSTLLVLFLQKTDVDHLSQIFKYCDVGTSFIWLSVDLLFLLSYLSSDQVGDLGSLGDLAESEAEQLTSDVWSGYPLDKVNTSYQHYLETREPYL